MSTWQAAFQFDSLVWDWIIAVYLFLAGMSAGAVMIAIYLKRNVIEGNPAENGIMKAMAWVAPFGIVAGLLILVFHLTKPLSFWKIMIYYNPSSVMSMGVILFQLYLAVLFIWIGIIFRETIVNFLKGRFAFVDGLLKSFGRFENAIEISLGVMAVILAAYTGFLLSALKTYPMLNNPVLPLLFLFSSLSSGAAASLLFGVVGFKESPTSPSVRWVHNFERPVVIFELFVLVTFFTGLIFSGGQSEASAWFALTGDFWSSWFWWGVIVFGMLVPLGLNAFSPKALRHSPLFIVVVTCLSLIGVLMLRTFVLYAGQMTVV